MYLRTNVDLGYWPQPCYKLEVSDLNFLCVTKHSMYHVIMLLFFFSTTLTMPLWWVYQVVLTPWRSSTHRNQSGITWRPRSGRCFRYTCVRKWRETSCCSWQGRRYGGAGREGFSGIYWCQYSRTLICDHFRLKTLSCNTKTPLLKFISNALDLIILWSMNN